MMPRAVNFITVFTRGGDQLVQGDKDHHTASKSQCARQSAVKRTRKRLAIKAPMGSAKRIRTTNLKASLFTGRPCKHKAVAMPSGMLCRRIATATKANWGLCRYPHRQRNPRANCVEIPIASKSPVLTRVVNLIILFSKEVKRFCC